MLDVETALTQWEDKLQWTERAGFLDTTETLSIEGDMIRVCTDGMYVIDVATFKDGWGVDVIVITSDTMFVKTTWDRFIRQMIYIDLENGDWIKIPSATMYSIEPCFDH